MSPFLRAQPVFATTKKRKKRAERPFLRSAKTGKEKVLETHF
jgi:hypothetical protein